MVRLTGILRVLSTRNSFLASLSHWDVNARVR